MSNPASHRVGRQGSSLATDVSVRSDMTDVDRRASTGGDATGTNRHRARPAPESVASTVPTRRRSLIDDLTEGVLALVREQRLPPGARLPSASILAQRFGVATPTMREALRVLEATGVVAMRHGSGTYVREHAPRMVIANPSRHPVESTVLDVLDARLLLEPELAERAARQCGASDGEMLARVLADGDAAIVAGDDEKLCAATMAFHTAIARVAGNVVLAEALRSITELYADHQLQIGRLFDDRELDQREHRALAAAIRIGQPHKVRRLMTAHLREVRDVVAARLGERESHRPVRKEA